MTGRRADTRFSGATPKNLVIVADGATLPAFFSPAYMAASKPPLNYRQAIDNQ
jgi:hypothetical protein